jgi:hypothetical protein
MWCEACVIMRLAAGSAWLAVRWTIAREAIQWADTASAFPLFSSPRKDFMKKPLIVLDDVSRAFSELVGDGLAAFDAERKGRRTIRIWPLRSGKPTIALAV